MVVRAALFTTASGAIARVFLQRHFAELYQQGVEVKLVLVDEQQSKQAGFVKHAWNVARRQAGKAKCPTIVQLARICLWKYLLHGAESEADEALPEWPAEVSVRTVGTLNARAVAEAVKAHGCTVICLMGTRIITRKALERLALPVFNIHSSDPEFVRGGPVVVWEVLDGRDHITLTIHEVVPEVDAGRICLHQQHPIDFCGGIGRTLHHTVSAARVVVAGLYRDLLLQLHTDAVTYRTPEQHGPLRVTPAMWQSLAADRHCRRRTRIHH